ncbi:cell wall hydrolase [Chenggangzhangella methanolivorans]|uniref:cell wall hydrolase n=1 Tax=Chenggangzhangella methanolivorans TaxID=1437009 RepID=UPI0036119DB3
MSLRLTSRSVARILIASSLVIVGHAGAEAAGRPARSQKAAIVKTDRECLARAMYFESRRTDEDGMLAVGTVVANRLAAGGRYGSSVCEVVGRPSQFAPGVLSRAMAEPKPRELAYRMADVVLDGGRHPVAGDALYFHTANVPFRHDDKRYVLVSGGNAFYGWNRDGGRARITSNLASLARAFAAAPAARVAAAPVAAGLAAPDATLFAAADAPSVQEILAIKPAEPAPAPAARPAPAPTTPGRDASGAGAILAYAAPLPAPVSGSALAAVAALEPKRPRVVVPAAPVQAAAGPVWPTRAESQSPARAWSPGAVADAAVAKAWALFDAVRR